MEEIYIERFECDHNNHILFSWHMMAAKKATCFMVGYKDNSHDKPINLILSEEAARQIKVHSIDESKEIDKLKSTIKSYVKRIIELDRELDKYKYGKLKDD